MDGLRRSIERGVVVTQDRSTNGNSWQKPAIAALWAVLVLFAGWMWTTNAEAQRDAALRLQSSQERIATLEEAVRGLTHSLDRIEAGVNELRRERAK
jgi:hypothetical protein